MLGACIGTTATTYEKKGKKILCQENIWKRKYSNSQNIVLLNITDTAPSVQHNCRVIQSYSLVTKPEDSTLSLKSANGHFYTKSLFISGILYPAKHKISWVNSHAHAALSDLHKLQDTKKIKQSCASVETKQKEHNYNGTTSCNLCDLAIYMSTALISQNSKQPINHSYHCILNNAYPIIYTWYKLVPDHFYCILQYSDNRVLS
jgi:hypothetical protein